MSYDNNNRNDQHRMITNRSTLNETTNTIRDIIQIYRTTNLNQLNQLITKLNQLETQTILNEFENNQIIEILINISRYLQRADQNLLFEYTNTIIHLTEKSIIKLNQQNLNYFIQFFIDLFSNVNDSKFKYDLYRCLGSLLYKTCCYITKYNLDRLIGDRNGLLTNYLATNSNNNNKFDENIYLIVVKCLFNLTLGENENENSSGNNTANNAGTGGNGEVLIDDTYRIRCFKLFVKVLRTSNTILNFGHGVYTTIVSKSLQGIENLFTIITLVPTDLLEDILAIVRTYSFYGLQLQNQKAENDTQMMEPLKPSQVLIPPSAVAGASNQNDDNYNSDYDNRNNNEPQQQSTNNRNKRYTKKSKKKEPKENVSGTNASGAGASVGGVGNDVRIPLIQYKQQQQQQLNTTTSESEYSDCESTNKQFFIEKCNAKVRVASISVLQVAFQTIDKRTILNYWDSFIPIDLNNYNKQSKTLFTSIIEDNSPKVRYVASNALAVFIDCAKGLFQLADDLNIQHIPQSFIPVSYKLASMLKQMHIYLLNAIENECFLTNTCQLLKCVQILIKSTPYTKLKPGLLIKLINYLKKYLLHRDKMNVRIACLQCFHALTQIKCAEIDLILKTSQSIDTTNKPTSESNNQLSDDIDSNGEQLELLKNSYKPSITPNKVTYFYTNSSGTQTPNLNRLRIDEEELLLGETTTSWLIDYCVKQASNTNNQQSPIQIRITCLDILLNICKNYFYLFRQSFDDIEKLITKNLSSRINTIPGDQDQITELNSTLKLLEELSRCMATDQLRSNFLDLNKCVKFWSQLIESSKLVTSILIDERNYLNSSSACDCLASIGNDIYELLPTDKRFLLITNLIGLTKSQSNLIRGSSIRALGVYVTYSSLKQDFNYLNDLSQSILQLLYDQNNLVRQKCAWSFANLSEVLVENKDKLGNLFISEFNATVYFKLLRCATDKCSSESDKIKSYLVRTLGNLLNYLTSNLLDGTLVDQQQIQTISNLNKRNNNVNQLNKETIERLVTAAIHQLIQCKNTKMLKVKWNLCHSIGVVLRNSEALSDLKWQLSFYDTLIDLFVNSTNYKVRINACMALLQQQAKRDYGFNDVYLRLWFHLFNAFYKLASSIENSSSEMQHKTTLLQQMCKLFTYLAKYVRIDDLNKINDDLLDVMKLKTNNYLTETKYIQQMKSYFNNYIHEITTKCDLYSQEIQLYNEALNQLNLLLTNEQNDDKNKRLINCLRYLLKKSEIENENNANNNNNYEQTDSLNNEFSSNLNENLICNDDVTSKQMPQKYPFKQIYD